MSSPSSTSDSSCGTTSETSASVGRLRTSPAAPSSLCSVTRTTVRRKFGSSRPGEATSSCPVRLGTRRERDEQPAVVVVRGKEVSGHRLRVARSGPQLQLLAETADAPFERELRGIALGLEAVEPEALDDVRAHQVFLAEPGQLEDPAADREDPPVAVADDHAGRRCRVVVLHQLEQEAEAAVVAGDRLVVEALLAVNVDRPLLAVRADEVRHEARV